MAANVQQTARTPDGRTLAIEEAGDPGGRPVLVPTPARGGSSCPPSASPSC
jgi:hypothetical protein